MRLVVLKRRKELRYAAFLVSAVSLVLGVLLYATIMSLFGVSLPDSLTCIARSFVTPSVVKDLFTLSMLGYALLVSFKASIWNIGGEGQFYIAMVPGVIFTLYLFNPESSASIPSTLPVALSVVAGASIAAAWAALAGAIRAYFKIDEVPVTIIMNYVIYYAVNYLVWGPLKGRRTYGYLRTDEIPEAYRLNVRIHVHGASDPLAGFFLSLARQTAYYSALLAGAIVVALLVWWLLKYTKLGLYITIMGSNPDYLAASGVDTRVLTIAALSLSGALTGFAGCLYLFAELGRLPYELERQTAGYGYLAVLVVWLSSLDPRLVPLSAYVVSALRNAGISIQVAGLGGNEQTLILIGSVLLIYALSRFLVEYEVRLQ